jgi:hypothetical protein
MGQSTDGIVAFGFNLGEELPGAWVDEEGDSGGFDFEEFVLAQAGVKYPDGEFKRNDPRWDTYRKAREEALAACPAKLVTHCSCDYPMFFLAVNVTETSASRGSAEEFDPKTPSADQIKALKTFCKQHGIEWQTPKWHVFSLWC